MSPNRSRRYRLRKKEKNKKVILIVTFLTAVALIIGAYILLDDNDSKKNAYSHNKVLLTTSMGNILIELRYDMPITTENFKNLVQRGVYDATIFHRVIADFMIQGGDPTRTGYGDPSIPNIQDEFTNNNKNERGTIAMANTGTPNSGSSQFFINVVYNRHLDNGHPVFGRIIEGMDVVDQISRVATDSNDRPIEDVALIKAQLVN